MFDDDEIYVPYEERDYTPSPSAWLSYLNALAIGEGDKESNE